MYIADGIDPAARRDRRLLPSGSIVSHYLSICAIFRDESDYLAEWLAFHALVGVEHFYLYNNNSVDDFRSVLAPWIAGGRVTLLDWPEPASQLRAYGHCITNHRRDSRWIAFVDLDEFLFSPEKEDLRALLAEYETAPGLAANWLMFGSSGHRERPPGPVTLAYRRRCRADLVIGESALLRSKDADPANPASYYPQCSHVKSIVDPRRVKYVRNPHYFGFDDGAVVAVNENWQPVPRSWSEPVSVERIRINHYWSKSLAELEIKLKRGRGDAPFGHSRDVSLFRERHFNEVLDETILPLARRLDEAALAGPPAGLP